MAGNELQIGSAAEHLVCADLLIAGHLAFLAIQSCPYDVVAEIGRRLVRIQVKATKRPRPLPGHFHDPYVWYVRRCGAGGKRLYGRHDFDVLALVALDCRKIAYVKPAQGQTTFSVRPHENAGATWSQGRRGRVFSQYSLTEAMPWIRQIGR